MKILVFQKEMRGTTAFMKRIMRVTKGYVQLSANYNSVTGIWFSEVKLDEVGIIDGLDY